MKLLIDTQVFIWLDLYSHRLSSAAKRLLGDAEYTLYLSSVSAWEICQKYLSGKLPLPCPAQQFISQGRRQYDIETLPFDEQSALVLGKLPRLHADPFDRMLICQALEHNMAILTSDAMIQRYPVKTIW